VEINAPKNSTSVARNVHIAELHRLLLLKERCVLNAGCASRILRHRLRPGRRDVWSALHDRLPNLWICDGSVFPTVGGVNPSLTIQAIACRTGDRIKELAARGKLANPARGRRARVLASATVSG
jgi:hypothetical protein